MTKRHENPVAAENCAERAQRIAAMLARWEAEDVSGEPDWDAADIEPMRFARGKEDMNL